MDKIDYSFRAVLKYRQGLREKISQGVRRSIRGPKSHWAPPSLIGAHAIKSFFVGRDVDLHLKVMGDDDIRIQLGSMKSTMLDIKLV